MITKKYAPDKYLGDGTQTNFPIQFAFMDKTHIRASLTINEVDYDLVVGQDYTVADSTLTTSLPVQTGAKLNIWLDMPLLQKTAYKNTGQLDLNELEKDLDIAAIERQQLKEEVNRAIKMPISSSMTPDQFSDEFFKAYSGMSSLEAVCNESVELTTYMYEEIVSLHADFKSVKYVAEIAENEPEALYDPSTNTVHLYLQQGPTGPQGPMGPQGPRGFAGDTGPAGPQGIEGPRGPQGPIGPEGSIGPEGPVGDVGPAGPQGPMGTQGATGERGPVGVEGPIGPVGPIGPQGIQGEKGEKGGQGDPGPTGAVGPQGPMGESPLELAFGRFFVDEDGNLNIEYLGHIDENAFEILADGTIAVNIS